MVPGDRTMPLYFFRLKLSFLIRFFCYSSAVPLVFIAFFYSVLVSSLERASFVFLFDPSTTALSFFLTCNEYLSFFVYHQDKSKKKGKEVTNVVCAATRLQTRSGYRGSSN